MTAQKRLELAVGPPLVAFELAQIGGIEAAQAFEYFGPLLETRGGRIVGKAERRQDGGEQRRQQLGVALVNVPAGRHKAFVGLRLWQCRAVQRRDTLDGQFDDAEAERKKAQLGQHHAAAGSIARDAVAAAQKQRIGEILVAVAAKPERRPEGRLADRKEANEVEAGAVKQIVDVLKSPLLDIHFAELDFDDQAADALFERIARSLQHLIFAGLHIERQEIGRRAGRWLRRDEAVEALRRNFALLQQPGAVVAEVEVDAECILNSVVEDAIELSQRGEAGVDVDMQQAIAVAIGQAGRNDDQLAWAVLAR